MTSNDTAHAPRKGLRGSIAGKAKDPAEAVTGKDSLTAEGQPQPAEPQARRDANTHRAVADAAAEQHRQVAAEAAQQAATVRQAQARKLAAVRVAARRQEGAGQAAVEQRTSSEIERSAAQTRDALAAATEQEATARSEYAQTLNDAAAAEHSTARRTLR